MVNQKNKIINPPLKWAGGKRWLLPFLRPIWEKHKEKRLVEPFSGGLAITLGLLPKKALLNDINPHLINFYNEIKRGLRISIKFENDSIYYYKKRERFNELLKLNKEKTKEAAEIFYYLNRTGFNGLCRFNLSGFYNIPFGRYKTINYSQDFFNHKKYFKKWKFTNVDFSKIKLKKNDFVFADPPYDVPFTHYSTGGFSWKDQVRTAEYLAKHPGPVVLCNQATKRIVDLYKSLGFKIQILDAPRLISCDGKRQKVKEVIATRNL